MITISTNVGKYFFAPFAKLTSGQTITVDEKSLLYSELLDIYESIISRRLIATSEDEAKVRKELRNYYKGTGNGMSEEQLALKEDIINKITNMTQPENALDDIQYPSALAVSTYVLDLINAAKVETDTKLEAKVSEESLNTTLGNYSTTEKISQDFVAKANLETSIDPIIKAAITDSLTDYAKSTDLDSYAKKTDLNGLAKTSDLTPLATKAELEPLALKTELAPLAKKTDLEPLALKTDVKPVVKKEASDNIVEVSEVGGKIEVYVPAPVQIVPPVEDVTGELPSEAATDKTVIGKAGNQILGTTDKWLEISPGYFVPLFTQAMITPVTGEV